MPTKIHPEHIINYLQREYENTDGFDEASKPIFYEALCETIVEKNPSYEIQELAEEWKTTDKYVENFVTEKFDAVISEDLKSHVTIKQREKWIDATVQGIHENK